MRYAKLINNSPVYAPNPILVDGSYIGNPPGSVYGAEGYKPVVYSDLPGPAPAGYQWTESWSEGDGNIVQSWVLVEITVMDGDQAMQFLFGGESDVE